MFGLAFLDIAKIIAPFVLGVVLTSVSYFIRRRIESKSAHESVDLFTKIAKMRTALQEAGISAEEAKEIAVLMGAKVRAVSVPASQEDDGEVVAQADMSQQAVDNAYMARAKLDVALTNLGRYLSEAEAAQSAEAQAAWERYCALEATFSSMIAEGGSMQPLLQAAAAERLTLDRLKFVEQSAEEHRALSG